MPSLSAYRQELEYSYAPGFFPAMEALKKRPACVERILIHSRALDTQAGADLMKLAELCHVRTETADRALSRISGKENCYAAAVFRKFADQLSPDRPHVVLHQPSDCGNVGTILRTALGFELEDVALIRPCADVFDPKTVRASMGSIFSLRVHMYPDFESYRSACPDHRLYPFMLDASVPLEQALEDGVPMTCALVFGNEGTGLPAMFSGMGQAVRIPSGSRVDSLNLSIAAGIGMYRFSQALGLWKPGT